MKGGGVGGGVMRVGGVGIEVGMVGGEDIGGEAGLEVVGSEGEADGDNGGEVNVQCGVCVDSIQRWPFNFAIKYPFLYQKCMAYQYG